MSHSSHALRLVRTSIIAGLALCLYAGATLADSLTVQPPQLSLSAKQPAGTVKLTNSGSEDRIVKFQVMSAMTVNGQQRLVPSRKLILHPEQLTVKSGSSQNVRVGLRLSGPLWEQENYKLVVTEVPRPPDIGSADAKPPSTNSLKLAVLPVAVLPPGQSTARMVSDVGSN